MVKNLHLEYNDISKTFVFYSGVDKRHAHGRKDFVYGKYSSNGYLADAVVSDLERVIRKKRKSILHIDASVLEAGPGVLEGIVNRYKGTNVTVNPPSVESNN
jgi:hypothetical protein